MITKTDILLLLTDLQNKGADVSADIKQLMSTQVIPLELLKKINQERPLDVLNFYEKIRASYNSKKSKLYINIMKSDENVINDDPITVLTTLSALLNQILQYKATDKPMFFKHVRCEEICQVLDIYFKTYNIQPALKLLTLFKADIKCLEMIK